MQYIKEKQTPFRSNMARVISYPLAGYMTNVYE